MDFFSKLFGQKIVNKPEEKYLTTITEKYVRVENPTRKTEEIQ